MQFLNPLFLIGFIAIAIPIIIHLFHFRRAKKVLFSNVAFLQSIQTQKRKTSQLKNLLILLMRILTLICLVIAFARPFIPQKNKPDMEGMQRVCIYVDNSFSMQASSENGLLLDEAKQKAKEIIKGYKQTDQFFLLTNDMEGKHQRFVSQEDMTSFIDEIDFSPATPPLSTLLKKAFDYLTDFPEGGKNIYLLSDFQKNRMDIEYFPTDTLSGSIWLIPLSGSHSDNLYIDSVWFDTPFFFEGSKVIAQIQIVNAGKTPVEKIPVKLTINGVQRALASVDLQPGESATVPLHFTISEAGIWQASVHITDYPIVFDDTYYFSLIVRKKWPVMSVMGEGTNPYLNRIFENDSAFEYMVVPENRIDYTHIPQQDFIVLDGLKKISTGLAGEMKRFVKEGGSLLIIPTEGMDKGSYEQAFADLRLPVFSEYITKENKVTVFNRESFLYKGVFEKIPDQLELPSVYAYFRIEIPQRSSTERIMTLFNQDPFLTVTHVDKGKVYMLCSPSPTSFSNFSSQMLYVPTLFNMALFSRPSSVQQYDINETHAIEIHTMSDEKDLVLKIRSVDGKTEVIPELKRRDGKVYLFLQNQFNQSGNYDILQGKEAISGLSLNYSRKESEREVYTSKELVHVLKQSSIGSSYQVIDAIEKPLDILIKNQYAHSVLWKWFVLLALAFVLTEVLLHRFWKEK